MGEERASKPDRPTIKRPVEYNEKITDKPINCPYCNNVLSIYHKSKYIEYWCWKCNFTMII